MTKQEIGAILLKLREESGKSREEVAELLGKSVKTIGHWETGYAQPDANTLFLLCTIYGADLNAAFGFPSKNNATLNLTPDEQTLVTDYRRLAPPGKEYVQQSLALALRSYSEKNNAVSELETAL